MEHDPQHRPEVRIARKSERAEFYEEWGASLQARLGEGRVRTRGAARELLAPVRTPTSAELERHGRIYYAGMDPSGENILDLEAPLPSAFSDGFHDVDEWHAIEGVTTPVSVEPVSSASPQALLLFRLHQKAARAVLEDAVRSYGGNDDILVPIRAPTLEETQEYGRVEEPGDGGLAAGVSLPSLFSSRYAPKPLRIRLTARGTEDLAGTGTKAPRPDPPDGESTIVDTPPEASAEEEPEEQIA